LIDYTGCHYAAIRHVGTFDGIGATFDRLSAWMHSHLPLLLGAPMLVYLDDPRQTPQDQQRCDAAVPVDDSTDLSDEPDLRLGQLDPGRCAVLRHRGAYSGLDASWETLTRWVADQGMEPDDSRSVFEEYATNPMEVPEEDWVTVLYLPVR